MLKSTAIVAIFMLSAPAFAAQKTVCSMTLNSSEEITEFKRALPAGDFKFVELTETGMDEKGNKASDWFKKSCDGGIKCDLVIISGHFGGSFFGSSGLRLTLDDLENASCQNQCQGILSNPKEVFLMGCNTLAGKTRDRRTPEEYVRVLMADGFSRAQAEAVATYRYSPIGASNAGRMSQSFSGVAKIYGFDAIGPAGKTVQPYLRKYLAATGAQYSAHLDAARADQSNVLLAGIMNDTSFTQTTGVVMDADQRPACVLGNQKYTSAQKIQYLKAGLLSDRWADFLTHASSLLSQEAKSEDPAVQSAKQEIAENPVIKQRLDSIMGADFSQLPSTGLRLAYTYYLSGVNPSAATANLRRTINALLNDTTIAGRDAACSITYSSLSFIPVPVTVGDLNSALDRAIANRTQMNFAQTFGCLYRFQETPFTVELLKRSLRESSLALQLLNEDVFDKIFNQGNQFDDADKLRTYLPTLKKLIESSGRHQKMLGYALLFSLVSRDEDAPNVEIPGLLEKIVNDDASLDLFIGTMESHRQMAFDTTLVKTVIRLFETKSPGEILKNANLRKFVKMLMERSGSFKMDELADLMRRSMKNPSLAIFLRDADYDDQEKFAKLFKAQIAKPLNAFLDARQSDARLKAIMWSALCMLHLETVSDDDPDQLIPLKKIFTAVADGLKRPEADVRRLMLVTLKGSSWSNFNDEYPFGIRFDEIVTPMYHNDPSLLVRYEAVDYLKQDVVFKPEHLDLSLKILNSPELLAQASDEGLDSITWSLTQYPNYEKRLADFALNTTDEKVMALVADRLSSERFPKEKSALLDRLKSAKNPATRLMVASMRYYSEQSPENFKTVLNEWRATEALPISNKKIQRAWVNLSWTAEPNALCLAQVLGLSIGESVNRSGKFAIPGNCPQIQKAWPAN